MGGSGILKVEQEQRPIWPSNAIFIHPGSCHVIANTSNEELALVGCLVIEHEADAVLISELGICMPRETEKSHLGYR